MFLLARVHFLAWFMLQFHLKRYQVFISLLSAAVVWLTKRAALSTRMKWLWPRSIYVWKITENECNLITSPVLSFAYVNVIPCWEERDRELMWNVVVVHASKLQISTFERWDVPSLVKGRTKRRVLWCLAVAWLLCEPLLKSSTVLGSPFVSLYSLGSVPPLCLL